MDQVPKPEITIIIPTYNASSYLKKLLPALYSQTIRNFELLIIDSSSQDDTIQIAKSFGALVFVIPKEEFDHGGVRTIAGKRAKGTILIYLTQDVLPYNKFVLENIISPFYQDRTIGAIYGRQIPYPKANLFAKHLRYFNYSEKSHLKSLNDKKKYGIKVAFLSNSFCAYRKSALKKIGWFKEGLIMGEDVYAGAKLLLAGYKLFYNSKAIVYHSHDYTIFQEFKRYFDIGVFYGTEKWISEEFGTTNREGLRYIWSEFNFMKNTQQYNYIFEFFIRNFLKYFGFKLGQKYNLIPNFLRKKISFHSSWWEKNFLL